MVYEDPMLHIQIVLYFIQDTNRYLSANNYLLVMSGQYTSLTGHYVVNTDQFQERNTLGIQHLYGVMHFSTTFEYFDLITEQYRNRASARS
jgi:hypothetical protein